MTASAFDDIGLAIAPDARARAAEVALMLFDIDGVFTDGRLHYGADGEHEKVFHVHDGHGVKLLQAAGVAVGIVSGRASAAAERRMRDLGVHLMAFDVRDKPAAVRALAHAARVSLSATGFMGDDWVDLAAMRAVHFAATVPNATRGMREHAHWVSHRAGGAGAVRDAAEFLLAARGALDAVYAAHLAHGVTQG